MGDIKIERFKVNPPDIRRWDRLYNEATDEYRTIHIVRPSGREGEWVVQLDNGNLRFLNGYSLYEVCRLDGPMDQD